MFIPTEQQEEFLAEALAVQHVMAIGLPGCGKTSMLTALVNRLPMRERLSLHVLAYNKHTKKDLEAKLPGIRGIRTIDGLAWTAVSRYFQTDYDKWRPDEWRYNRFIGMFARTYWPDTEDGFTEEQMMVLEETNRLRSITQATLTDYTDPNAIACLIPQFNLEVADPEFSIPAVMEVLKWGMLGLPAPDQRGQTYSLKECFCFDDLPWYCHFNEAVKVPRVARVIADECQDWTDAQWGVVQKAIGENGKFAGVGDPNQALYFFRGVRADIFGRIVHDLNARLCLVSRSFRVPEAQAALARRYVGEFTGNGKPGSVVTIDPKDILSLAQRGQVYISLRNADAIRTCYQLLKANKPAHVKGRNISDDMINLVDTVERKMKSFGAFLPALDQWRRDQCAAVSHRLRNPERAIEEIGDRAESLACLYEGAVSEGIKDVGAFRERIRQLFTADDDDSQYSRYFVCMTAHKSKGLEFPVVYLEAEDLNSERGGSPQEIAQHRNCRFVMLSRAQETTYIRRKPNERQEDEGVL